MRIAEVDGREVTAASFEEMIFRHKGFRSVLRDVSDGHVTLEFDWHEREPFFRIEHVILDGSGPSLLALGTETAGLTLLDSWHIHDEDFKEIRGPKATVVDVVGGGRSSYMVPIAKARFTRNN